MRQVDLYTDGACSGNPGPGGWGAILIYKDHKKELKGSSDGVTTNSRMEVMAVYEGLKALKEPCEVNLYSDSKYVVDTIEFRWYENWEINNYSGKAHSDLWIEIVKLLKKHNVKAKWVKGHAGNIYNELADVLASSSIKRG